MDNNNKPSNSPADSSSLSTSSNYLRQVNKLSHKISKPTINREINLPLPPPPPLHQHQPPVYNINKSDFRDVVQKLTGSPSQNRISSSSSSPPSIQKTQSTRLHRIRPPPLAHVINHPPSLLNNALNNQNWTGGFNNPLSPLPPLPPVHAAAESPVSSYMRYLQNSMLGKELSPLAPLVSPRWYQQQQQQQENVLPPKSPYGLLSPSVLLSPVSPKTVSLPTSNKGH